MKVVKTFLYIARYFLPCSTQQWGAHARACRRGALVRPDHDRHAGLVDWCGASDPSLTRFSYVKPFNMLFYYKVGT
jgi:hypothetical protein